MTIKQVADELKVSTKTLRRWEEKGYLVPDREETTRIRLYHPYLINYWKKLLELDRTLKKHLGLLDGLRKELDKHMLEQVYKPGESLKLLDFESFNKAYETMEKWENDYKRLFNELLEYPRTMVKATGENYDKDEK